MNCLFRKKGGDGMRINMLKAEHGDCFIISLETTVGTVMNILVDGGTRRTYRYILKNTLCDIIKRGETLDIIIVTHIDDDHISGIISLFNDTDFISKLHPKVVIYNFYNSHPVGESSNNYISYRQGDILSELLVNYNKRESDKVKIYSAIAGDRLDFGGVEICILSPLLSDKNRLNEIWKRNQISAHENDYAITLESCDDIDGNCSSTITNKSSISFIVSCEAHAVLMMGDAPPDLICQQLLQMNYGRCNPLKLSAIKLSHHGGENSINSELLGIIDCDKFLVSTNGKIFKHPRKKTLGRIIKNNSKAKLYLNYKRDVFTDEEINLYGIDYHEEISILNL